MKRFPVIDQPATGENILRLRKERGLTVRDLQSFFGFEEPQAIYKWQRGESLPSVDNLYALGSILEVPMEEILVPKASLTIVKEQQDKACCSDFFAFLFARALWAQHSFEKLWTISPSESPCASGTLALQRLGPFGLIVFRTA